MDGKELTPEELKAKLQKFEELEAKNKSLELANKQLQKAAKDEADELEAKNRSLEFANKQLRKAAKDEAAKNAPVSFEVEDDEENGIEGGTYEFTCPLFTWDDNSIINVRMLANSTDKKYQEKYELIKAHLVARKSGIVIRKED